MSTSGYHDHGGQQPAPTPTTFEEHPVTPSTPAGHPGTAASGCTGTGSTATSPIDRPLPYGMSAWPPAPETGFGVDPVSVSRADASEPVPTRRSGSPILAVAGILCLTVATWVIVGTPAISGPVILTVGVLLAVLVGLVMIFRG